MQFKLQIAGFKCYRNKSPLVLDVTPGITAIIGPNNAGKSAALLALHSFKKPANALRTNSASKTTTNFQRADISQGEEDIGYSGMFSFDLPDEEKDVEIHFKTNLPPSGNIDISCTDPRTQFINPCLSAIENMMYIGSARYVVGSGSDYYSVSVGSNLSALWNSIASSPEAPKRMLADEIMNDLEALLQIKKLRITGGQQRDLIFSMDGENHPLESLGAGVGHIVTTVINAAILKPSYLLIDEPELSLHPSLQVEYLESLDKYTEFGIIFTTHSMGLVDSVADSTFSVTKGVDGSKLQLVDDLETSDLTLLLGEMGYRNTSKYLGAAIILVEGPTEVRSIRSVIRKMGVSSPFVVLMLGGSSTIKKDCHHQLEQVLKLSDKVISVIDSERQTAGGDPDEHHSAFAVTCSELHIPCHLSDLRAFENYLPPEAVEKAYPKGTPKPLGPYEDPKPAGWRSFKRQNYRVVRWTTSEYWRDTDIGKFLLQHL